MNENFRSVVKKLTGNKKPKVLATLTQTERDQFRAIGNTRTSINAQLEAVQYRENQLWKALRDKYALPEKDFKYLTVNQITGKVIKTF